MHYRIRHTTRYQYDRPVFLEPHLVRLHPRADGTQALTRFELRIAPEPAGRSLVLDPEGNTVVQAWFEDMTRSLEITAESEVTTHRVNPFDFLPAPEAERLPVRYAPAEARRLAPYLARAGEDAAVDAFAAELVAASGGAAPAFLDAANQAIYERVGVVIREEGPPRDAAHTLALQEGSCRDLTVLFMELCRSVGLAARFVSGYQEGDADQCERYLHAWGEAYVPGGGWRGYDPTHGLAVADRHIAVACAAHSADAAPVQGSFRGTGATQEISYVLEIERRQ